MTAGTFRISDPLPLGRVALEASAGTGKTWSIVGVATRALAEGRCTADGLLVVTFARSATRELRSRLLERLDQAVLALDRALVDGPGVIRDGEDALLAALVTDDPDQPGGHRTHVLGVPDLRLRRDRLVDALAEIDTATVTTIHGFCAEALDRLGDVGRGTLLDDEQAFAADIAGDLRLRVARDQPDSVASLPFYDHSIELARAGLVTDPADVIPDPGLTDYDAAKAWFTVEAHAEARRRKRRSRVHTFDDLLRRLADRLDDPAHGADAALRVGGRYRLALIDEFQDTDPVQWRILSRLFPDTDGADGRALVLVGDPKQAIYSFRGADVHAYVAARGDGAGQQLDVNRRSDRAVVDAVLALFTGQPMGQGIDVPAVTAAHDDRIEGLGGAPVVLTTIPDDAAVRRTDKGDMQLGGLRDTVARDVARQTVQLLQAGGRIAVTPDGSPAGTAVQQVRPIAPDDIAVLVRTRHQASLVQTHLVRAGVPSVVNGVGNVLASPAARDWMHVLRALDRPSQAGLARLAAMTDLVGWSPGRVAAATDADTDALHITLHDWRQVLASAGVAAAFRHICARTGLAARLLSRPDGDRKLTDLEHVAELLHAHSSTHVVGTAGLLAWLELGAADAAASSRLVPPDHLASRLERSGDAVQIMTVHGAKGMEFGIVLAPYLWDVVGRAPVVRTFHDHTVGRRRTFVGGRPRGADQQHMVAIAAQEVDQEERRLAYVAATRARHHLRLWWAPASTASSSPLGTLLARPALIRTTAQARESLAVLQQGHPGLFDVVDADLDAPPLTLAPQPATGPDPVLAVLGRGIDGGWRRTSYSRLVGDVHAAADEVGGQGDLQDVQASPGVSDEEQSPGDAGGADRVIEVPVVLPDPTLTDPVPLGPMRGGADVGSTLHAVLEHVDFTAADLPAALRRHLDREVERHAIDLGEEAELDDIAAGLAAALTTPLSPGGPSLVQVGRDTRLDELAFELPVLTEELAVQPDRVLITDIADLLDAHLPPDDPLATYGSALRHGLADIEVRGFLAGFIDLLVQLPGRADYLVADYKTNRMAPAGVDDVTVGHFTAQTMTAEMITHHYPLQALVYLVATHRYLRWRIRDYDPDTHLAGVAYLFLRGMTGPDTPVRDGMVCGVFRWRPPTALLLALDGLLTRGIDPEDRDGRGGRA